MLIFFIVWLRCRALFLRATASNEYLALGLFLEALLVVTLWPYEQANVIDAWVLRHVHFLLELAFVLQSIQDGRVQVAHIVLIGVRHELFIEVVALLVFNRDARILLLLDLLLGGITPNVCVPSFARRLAREIYVLFVSRDAGERIERRVSILHDLRRLLKLFKVHEATLVADTFETCEPFLIPISLLVLLKLLLFLHPWDTRSITKT